MRARTGTVQIAVGSLLRGCFWGGDMGEFEMVDRLHCCGGVERADLDEPVAVVDLLMVHHAYEC